MLIQLAASRQNWMRVNPGKHGAHLNCYLLPEDEHLHSVLLQTPTCARRALETIMQNYQKLSASVAEALGYPVDDEEAARVIQFIEKTYGS